MEQWDTGFECSFRNFMYTSSVSFTVTLFLLLLSVCILMHVIFYIAAGFLCPTYISIVCILVQFIHVHNAQYLFLALLYITVSSFTLSLPLLLVGYTHISMYTCPYLFYN